MKHLACITLTMTLMAILGCSSQPAKTAQLPSHDTLSKAEVAGLLTMREEEKLARDVYAALGEKWPKRIFTNISRSEQRHMNAIKGLLDQYGLDDPAAGKGPGEFTDPRFTDLYHQLVAKGEQSQSEAIKIGVAIEELDIADLEAALEDTDREDIRVVYTNLLQASHRHLRAFSSHLN